MRKGLKDEGEHFENNIFNYSDYDVEKIDEFLEENNIYIVEANNNKYQNTDLSSYEIKEYGHYLVINTCLN